eukprot:gene8868-biopygen7624
MLWGQPAGSLVGATPCGGMLMGSLSAGCETQNKKKIPQGLGRFSRGAAPREEGRRGPPSGPAGPALGDERAGSKVKPSTLLPRFCKSFPCYLARSGGAARPCDLPLGMRFPSFPFLVAHVAALRAPAWSDPAEVARATSAPPPRSGGPAGASCIQYLPGSGTD